MTRFTLNNQPVEYRLDPATPLLWALRDASNLTGTKYGCGTGSCGACTVDVDGRAAGATAGPGRAVLSPAGVAAAGAALYAWGAEGRADRDRMIAWGDRTCAAAGAELMAQDKAKRGLACNAAILALARFKADANDASARALIAEIEEREGKMSADAVSARAAASA